MENSPPKFAIEPIKWPKRATRVVAALIGIGLACFALFDLIGSTLDGQGFVHEPFFLVPIGWLLIGLGSILGVVGLLFRCVFFYRNDIDSNIFNRNELTLLALRDASAARSDGMQSVHRTDIADRSKMIHRERKPIAMIGQRSIATISIRQPIKRHTRSRHD
jgi:hypothetical protein